MHLGETHASLSLSAAWGPALALDSSCLARRGRAVPSPRRPLCAGAHVIGSRGSRPLPPGGGAHSAPGPFLPPSPGAGLCPSLRTAPRPVLRWPHSRPPSSVSRCWLRADSREQGGPPRSLRAPDSSRRPPVPAGRC